MFKIFKRKINKKWAVLMSVVLGVFLKIKVAHAQLVFAGLAVAGLLAWFNRVALTKLTLFTIVGGLAYFFAWVVGYISLVFTSILFTVSQYSGFINEEVVLIGWPIVRDLCNMFFVLILLIIAFATILRIESYNLKKTLPKLIIMAILINFSRTICGLAIDFAQVIMLTFVNAFGSAGAGNLYSAFGIQNLYTWDTLKQALNEKSNIEKNLGFATTGSLVLALILIIIFTMVIVIFTIILIFRIIMLWILIILSPLAFLSSVIPPTAKYTQQWVSEFTKYVIIGPVMAFFLWLALSISAPDALNMSGATETLNKGLSMGSQASRTADMKQFTISALFLLAGLMMAQKSGVAGGGMAGSFTERVRRGAVSPLKLGAKVGAKGGKALVGVAADKIHEKYHVDLNLARVWGGLQDKRKEIQQKRYATGMAGADEIRSGKGGRVRSWLAMTSSPGHAWEQIWDKKGRAQLRMGGKKLDVQRKKAVDKLNLEQFKLSFTKMTGKDRKKKLEELSGESLELDNKIKSETDEKVRLKHVKDKQSVDDKLKYASDEFFAYRTGEQQEGYESTLQKNINDYSEQVNWHTPMYDSDARSAGQKVVRDAATKIEDVNDGGELLRVLIDAVKTGDKAMVKAVTKKMTKNGDENEFLQRLAGDSGFQGLQKYMRLLVEKGGFGEQEAFTLGSEISNIAKGTNHWAATGAYVMENGSWREAKEMEQATFRANEMGKMYPQARARQNNRLAYGSHDGKGEFHIDIGGLMALKTFDNEDGRKQVTGQMTESAAKYLWTEESQKVLRKAVTDGLISPKLVDAIRQAAEGSITDYEGAYNKFKTAFGKQAEA